MRKALSREPIMKALRRRTFYCVGGTWRALARLHMWQTGYPLHVMHGYAIPAREALEFARLVHRVDPDTLSRIDVVSEARRPLLALSARWCSSRSCASASRSSSWSPRSACARGCSTTCSIAKEQRRGSAARGRRAISTSCARARRATARSWSTGPTGSWPRPGSRRRPRSGGCVTPPACSPTSAGARIPTIAASRSLNIIAHAAFIGVDHPGRAFLALSVFFRHDGLAGDELSPRVRELATTRLLDRARILGAAMRVAYIVSASMPGVLPRAPLAVERGRLVLRLQRDLADLAGDRLKNRLRQLGKLVGRDTAIFTK